MARCVVIGSVAMDELLELRQPMRAGRHVDGHRMGTRLGGGAANTGLPLAYAGHEVTLVSAVGTDGDGDVLLAELRSAGIDTQALVRLPGRSTRSLVLLDPGGERTIINLHRCRESGPPVRIRGMHPHCLYVRSREEDLAALLSERLSSVLVVAHIPPLATGSRPAHILVASESDLDPDAHSDPWALGQRIAGPPLRWVVLTRGARGATAFSATGRIDARAPAVRALDTTGAGDVFAAGLVHALLAGKPIAGVLQTAVAWGAAAVRCHGIPSRRVIEELARETAVV